MNQIKAIGFDLFNTLVIAKALTLNEALSRLSRSLQESGLSFHHELFKKAHKEAAVRFLKETRQNGRETHNRFWISAALQTLGSHIPPEDPRVAKAANAYFSAFLSSQDNPDCQVPRVSTWKEFRALLNKE